MKKNRSDRAVAKLKSKVLKGAAKVAAVKDAKQYLRRQDITPERSRRILDEFLVRQYRQIALPPELAKVARERDLDDSAARELFAAWWVWEAEENSVHDRGIRLVVEQLDKAGEPVPPAFRNYLEKRRQPTPDRRRGPKTITLRARRAVIIRTIAAIMIHHGLDEITACSVVQKALEETGRHMTHDAILKVWKRGKHHDDFIEGLRSGRVKAGRGAFSPYWHPNP